MHRQTHNARSLLTFAWDKTVHLEDLHYPRQRMQLCVWPHVKATHWSCLEREWGSHCQHHLKCNPIIVTEKTLVFSFESKKRIWEKKNHRTQTRKEYKTAERDVKRCHALWHALGNDHSATFWVSATLDFKKIFCQPWQMISEWARNGIPSRCQICPLLDVNIPYPRIAVQNTSQQLTMRKVIGKRSGSRTIHKKPPELSLQSGEDSKGHCGGLGALEKPSWPRSWRSLSVRPCFPGWGWEPFQAMPLGEHNLPH